MNFRFIIHDFKVNLKQWSRSKGTVFWTILFPILLILIFGSMFSESGDVNYSLCVQDLDESIHSQSFLQLLQNVSLLEIKELSPTENITSYMQGQDISTGLKIPEGFGSTIDQSFSNQNITASMVFHFDPSKQTTTSIVQTILSSLLQEYNLAITGGRTVVTLADSATVSEDLGFIDFFIPGMIGFTIMTSCIYGSIERNTKYRKDGILRKMLTMPVSRTDWIFAKMLFMLFLSFLSTTVILIFGFLVFDLSIHLSIFTFIIIVATSFLFSGMGMIIGRFVKEEETADMAGGAITFPMMFLAGTFFPLEQMPGYLQSIAQLLPLYYVNESLRNTMILNNMDKTLYFTAFVVLLAAIFFIIGVFVTKWKED
jgi:ABC-2 type transport system permease protein